MLLENVPYEFKEMNIFEGQDAVDLNKINPINQIPVLTDGERTIWDSRQIFNYLNSIHRFQNMDWNDENQLTAIDGAMNAGVTLLMLKRSGININEPYLYINRQHERIDSVLDYLKPYFIDQGLKDWNFQSISLYCFLDWAIFREIIKIDRRPECQSFLDVHKNKNILQYTQIPKV